MAEHSAGIVLFRRGAGELWVLAVHPGGPYWAKKDEGAWSIPKGEYDQGSDPLAAARREFQEELGIAPPVGGEIDLGEVSQAGGKIVRAWAIEGDLDVSRVQSNEFQMEWPPRSGAMKSFPEVDRAEWFTLAQAARKLNQAQSEFLDRLVALGHGIRDLR